MKLVKPAIPLATLPSKQGLKQICHFFKHFPRGRPLATLPSKQGLKPQKTLNDKFAVLFNPLATLPSKQGLKLGCLLLGFCGLFASCYTSIKTRIETDGPPLGYSPRRTSSCYTSIKTRIETRIRPISFSTLPRSPLATLPSKQGLKLDEYGQSQTAGYQPLATLPSKQGLKHYKRFRQLRQWNSSCYTSIKTRIETATGRPIDADGGSPLATLPSKQGLKPVMWEPTAAGSPTSCYTSIKTRIETGSCMPFKKPTSTSCYTSIKTRIETFRSGPTSHGPRPPLATLPSKQGLKPARHRATWGLLPPPLATLPSKQGLKRKTCRAHRGMPTILLLLHFHQNKD